MINLYFVDRNSRVVDAIKEKFSGRGSSEVSFHFINDDIFSIPADAYVTAGNSYAIMSGGIDLAFRNMFGTRLQDIIQEEIFFKGEGKLSVGEAISVKTKLNNQATHIIYAPTMEKLQDISNTKNVYFAFSAILDKSYSLSQNEYKSNFVVACPGLGCLTGQMPYDKMADQLLEAWLFWQYDVFKSSKNGTILKSNV